METLNTPVSALGRNLKPLKGSVRLNANIQVTYANGSFWYQEVEDRGILKEIRQFVERIKVIEGVEHSLTCRPRTNKYVFTVNFLKPTVTLDLADISHLDGKVEVLAGDKLLITLYNGTCELPIKRQPPKPELESAPGQEPAVPSEKSVERRTKEYKGTKRLRVWQNVYFGVGALSMLYLLVERVVPWLFPPSALSDP